VRKNHITRHSGLAILALMTLLVLGGMAGQATGYSPGCGQIPIVGGIPPWGFHTGPPIGETGSFARGHGQIDLEANTVSGILCQEDRARNQPTRAITMTVEHHLVYHSHYAVMWGFPGNIMKIILRVRPATIRNVRSEPSGARPCSEATTASVATVSNSSSRLRAGITTTCTTDRRSTTRCRRFNPAFRTR
jgi:hypothetical protein